MRYFNLKDDTNIEDFLNELNNIEGVNAYLEVEESDTYQPNELHFVVTSKAIKLELERILILLEDQKEYNIAISKIKDLYSLITKIEQGFFEFKIKED